MGWHPGQPWLWQLVPRAGCKSSLAVLRSLCLCHAPELATLHPLAVLGGGGAFLFFFWNTLFIALSGRKITSHLCTSSEHASVGKTAPREHGPPPPRDRPPPPHGGGWGTSCAPLYKITFA